MSRFTAATNNFISYLMAITKPLISQLKHNAKRNQQNLYLLMSRLYKAIKCK